MLSRQLVLLGVCSAALGVVLPGPAYACVGTQFRVDDVPANGLVQLHWGCPYQNCRDKEVPNPLRIQDQTTMTEVPGAVVWAHGMGTRSINVFWKPSEPLTPGRTYRVLDVAGDALYYRDFEALPAVTWLTTAELEPRDSLTTTERAEPGEFSCPERYQRNACTPDAPPFPQQLMLSTNIRTSVVLSASFDRDAVPPLKKRAVFWREGDSAPDLSAQPWSVGAESHTFNEGAERYCYRTAVHNLLDGSEREWEGCVEHGDLPAPGTRPRAHDEIAHETERCSAPPTGLEDEWCEESLMACKRHADRGTLERNANLRADCENVATRCATQQDAGVEEDKPAPRDSGCSVTQPRGAGWSRLLPLIAAFTLPAMLRRKRKSQVA